MTQRKQLHVSSATRHGRRYLNWRESYGQFKTGKRGRYVSGHQDPVTLEWIPGRYVYYQENLCHYWRVVTFWAFVDAFILKPFIKKTWIAVTPLTTLLTLLGVGFVVDRAIVYPKKAGEFALAILLIFIAACVAVGVIAGGVWIFDQLKSRRSKDETPNDPGLVSVTYQFLQAKKHKICPLIVVDDDVKATS